LGIRVKVMKRGKVEIRPSRRSSKSATVINFLKFPMRKPIYLFLVSITVAVFVPFFARSAEKLDAYGYKDLLWKHIVVQSNNRRFEIAELDKIARDFILERDPHFPASNIVAVILIPDISIPDERTNYMAKLHSGASICQEKGRSPSTRPELDSRGPQRKNIGRRLSNPFRR